MTVREDGSKMTVTENIVRITVREDNSQMTVTEDDSDGE